MKKSDFSEIKKKGFHPKWWAKKRALKCRGSNVGKELKRCNDRGIGTDGLLLKGDFKQREQYLVARTAYRRLELVLNGAKSRCGKSEAETKEGIVKYYLPRIVEGLKKLEDREAKFIAKRSWSEENITTMKETAALEVELKSMKKIADKIEADQMKLSNKLVDPLGRAVAKVSKDSKGSDPVKYDVLEPLQKICYDGQKKIGRLNAAYDLLKKKKKKLEGKYNAKTHKAMFSDFDMTVGLNLATVTNKLDDFLSDLDKIDFEF